MMPLVALFAFMLIPVWIPIITVAFGAVYDLFRPSEPSELTERMEALKSAQKSRQRAHLTAVPSPATN